MNLLLSALLGAFLSGGLLLIWRAWIGWGDAPKKKRAGIRDRADAGNIWGWLLLGLGLFLLTLLLTRWITFSIGVGCGAAIIRQSVLVNRRARISIETGHALASWVEALAAVMRTHSGLSESISSTAEYASPLIANDVRILAADAQSRSLPEALADFAIRVDHGASDRIAMALIVADSRQTTDLSGLLSEMADLTQQRAEFVSEIAASRSRIFTEAKAIVGFTLFMTVIGILLGKQWLKPFDEPLGEIVLAFIVMLYIAASYLLVQLGKPSEQPRFLTFSRLAGRR